MATPFEGTSVTSSADWEIGAIRAMLQLLERVDDKSLPPG